MRRFETLNASLTALEHQQRQYGAQFFILQALSRGVDVSFIRHELKPLEKAQLKTCKNELTEQAALIRQQAIKGENQLSDEAFKALQQQVAKTKGSYTGEFLAPLLQLQKR